MLLYISAVALHLCHRWLGILIGCSRKLTCLLPLSLPPSLPPSLFVSLSMTCLAMTIYIYVTLSSSLALRSSYDN